MTDKEALCADIEQLLRTLRQCDTQPTAVAWMRKAYTAMERSLEHLSLPERANTVERLVFVPAAPMIEVVQSISGFDIKEAEQKRRRLQERSHANTVVYPEVFLPPGLKPLPKAWTRSDTLRLERAAKSKSAPIQRSGR